MSRCQWPDGVEIRPDGVHRLDPCSYDVIEEHRDVTVRVLRCRRCGHQEIEWEDTGRWIPISERLPENDEMMLVTCRAKNGNLSVNRAYYMDGCWHGSGSMAGVTAWMPLPEPYREEDINPT